MEQYLDDCTDPVSIRRNTTTLSKFCEELVITFIKNNAVKAYVRHELAPFDFETLYKGLYNVSRKNDFKRLVKVHKQEGKIMLLRCRK
jgi:hypothetical protein